MNSIDQHSCFEQTSRGFPSIKAGDGLLPGYATYATSDLNQSTKLSVHPIDVNSPPFNLNTTHYQESFPQYSYPMIAEPTNTSAGPSFVNIKYRKSLKNKRCCC
eukprot:GHVL01023561.1.p1 GENE.GHVL01023561.1~~GHVL01023561.1.p1  ORF type:complete len:104 (+),score=8.50 GHVL01023561.1:108-419(+)